MPVALPNCPATSSGPTRRDWSSPRSRSTRLGSYRQLTDVHLEALAAGRKGKLATFDRGIPRALHPAEQAVVELLPVV